MTSISNSVTASGAGGTAMVTTAGGPGGAPPITIAAFQNADVLIVAVPHGLASGCGHGGVPARRPVRPQVSEGWAQPTICTQTGASSAAKTAKSSGSSSTTKSTSASTAKSSDPLAFLSDPRMSVEEKLFRFLAWVADGNEKDLLKKMDEICAKQKKESSSKKGLLGSIASGVGGALGLGGKGPLGGLLGPVFSAAGIAGDLLRSTGLGNVVSQLSGPVLAAGASALGFPMLAPALMKAGPALAQGAMGLLDGATRESGGDKESGTSSTSRDKEGSISQMDAMELEWLQEKQKQMFGLISNVMKAIHDTKMAVINNIRA